ncbi:hypothetical protein EUAN_07890 [Andreesenia angusta]|uniref:Uncharacterized protein n=1 Tax=Andreesenia angusta TaxID=39480 RepID=A0A1S1V9C0_9FIRM|nr:DUF1292 domain-containing protein [Andreesenia angusta]OHW63005.1 hypothetical protein EUAN_07890 [Andreesenia angusta]
MNKNTIELLNEDGEVEVFMVEAYFDLEDTKYTVLVKEGEEEGLLMRVDYDEDGNPLFSFVEDEEELNEAAEAYESLLSE